MGIKMINITKIGIIALLIIAVIGAALASDSFVTRDRLVPIENVKEEFMVSERDYERLVTDKGEEYLESVIIDNLKRDIYTLYRECIRGDYDQLKRCYIALDSVNDDYRIVPEVIDFTERE